MIITVHIHIEMSVCRSDSRSAIVSLYTYIDTQCGMNETLVFHVLFADFLSVTVCRPQTVNQARLIKYTRARAFVPCVLSASLFTVCERTLSTCPLCFFIIYTCSFFKVNIKSHFCSYCEVSALVERYFK